MHPCRPNMECNDTAKSEKHNRNARMKHIHDTRVRKDKTAEKINDPNRLTYCSQSVGSTTGNNSEIQKEAPRKIKKKESVEALSL